jgi:hypothetical protein
MPVATLNPPGQFTWILRCAYALAALATAAMGWLAASGAVMRLMPIQAGLTSAPPMFRTFIDLIWYVQIAGFLILIGAIVFLIIRPLWWGKVLCAFAAVSWTGSCLMGLAQGQFGFDETIKIILAAGATMACVAALHQWLDPRIDRAKLRRLFKR